MRMTVTIVSARPSSADAERTPAELYGVGGKCRRTARAEKPAEEPAEER